VSVQAVALTAIRGPLLLSTVDGRFPSGAGQIGLGAATMRQVGAHVGSVVPVSLQTGPGQTRSVPFRVVATVAFPTGVGSEAVSLGTGAALTATGYLDAVCPPNAAQASCRNAVNQSLSYGVLASAVPGARGRAAITHYLDAYQSITSGPGVPSALVNFGEAVNFPLIFGVMLGVFGASTLAHLLVVSVGRRRHEIGLLKALGFVNAQVGAAVCWQATTVALVGIVIGMPSGVAVGQVVWRAFATNLGVVPVAVVNPWHLGVLVAFVLMMANVLAVAPALVATRSKPGQLLRTP
jgi:hypothetical protein